jgi:hypothetical protein
LTKTLQILYCKKIILIGGNNEKDRGS